MAVSCSEGCRAELPGSSPGTRKGSHGHVLGGDAGRGAQRMASIPGMATAGRQVPYPPHATPDGAVRPVGGSSPCVSRCQPPVPVLAVQAGLRGLSPPRLITPQPSPLRTGALSAPRGG